MTLLLFIALAATDRADPRVNLAWSNDACPGKKQVTRALATYGVGVAAESFVRIEMRPVSDAELELLLEAKGARSSRRVRVPYACAERAAVVAVVIEALVTPYFWPQGRDAPASAAASTPSVSALDLLLQPPPSQPASEPASVPATAPTSEPASVETFVAPASVETFVAPASVETSAPPIPFTLSVLGGFSAGLPEAVKYRFGVAVSVAWPERVRWFFELDVLAPRSVDFAPGRITALPVHLFLGVDVRLVAGWFAGAAAGVQLLVARADGFDESYALTVVSPSLQVRTGYRHTFVGRWEIGAHVLLRSELGRVRLLIDDTIAYEAPALHVGAVVTFGVVL